MKILSLLGDYNFTGDWSWLNNVFAVLNPVLYAIMAVVGAAGAIYAIYLGVNLAKAEDQSKRDEAKKRLITTLIAVAVTIALVLFFTQIMPLILQAVAPKTNIDGGNTDGKTVRLCVDALKGMLGK